MAASMPSRIRLLTITGGEPFLRADLPEIISAFDNLNNTQRISIVTNGDLPENAEQSVRKILEDSSVLLTLQVSIQSPSDLVNQSPAAETLKRFITLQKKISRISQVAALTTVGIHNFDRVPELMEMIASNYKILHKIQFLRGIPGNVFPSDPDVLSDLTPENFQAQELNTEDQKKTAKMVRERLTFSENPLMDRIMLEHLELAIRIRELRKPVFPCLAGKADAVIFEDGRISVCENFKPFAGLKDFQMNFRALWDSPEAEKHRKLVHGCACTHPCNIVTSISYDKNSLKKILL
jgi:MoaA/NifB/PqqE/SkfB family radical SAM enzyme